MSEKSSLCFINVYVLLHQFIQKLFICKLKQNTHTWRVYYMDELACTEFTLIYPLTFTGCYFHTVKISKVLVPPIFTVWTTVKITSYNDVTSCIACLKHKGNIMNRKCNDFDVKYEFCFHTWDRIFKIFSRVLRKYQKSCLTREINSIFNVKPLHTGTYPLYTQQDLEGRGM